jgi:hypothetical protein
MAAMLAPGHRDRRVAAPAQLTGQAHLGGAGAHDGQLPRDTLEDDRGDLRGGHRYLPVRAFTTGWRRSGRAGSHRHQDGRHDEYGQRAGRDGQDRSR